MSQNFTLHHGDCLEIMKTIPDGSVDMVLCDLPYGTTGCKWDIVIPFEPLWKQYKRIIKPNAPISLFGMEPFSSILRVSNLDWYKYDWIWDKKQPSDFHGAKHRPLSRIEKVSVFSSGTCSQGGKSPMPYFPQMEKREKPRPYRDAYRKNRKDPKFGPAMTAGEIHEGLLTHKYPTNIIVIGNTERKGRVHPTQKPIALLEYLIKTYTNEGETVLDNCMGSGSTGVACININRKFIGIEKDAKYFEIAQKRITEADSVLLK